MTANTTWDPYRTLDVNPNAVGFTCVGYASTRGRRCHNVIAFENRDAACRLLDRIAVMSPQQTEVLEGFLGRLAPMVLCKRWHQNQTDEVVNRWLLDATKLNVGSSVSSWVPSLSVNLGATVSQPGSWTFTPIPPSTIPRLYSNVPVQRPAITPLPATSSLPATIRRQSNVPALPPPPATTPLPASSPPLATRRARSNAPSPIPRENYHPLGQSTTATATTTSSTTTTSATHTSIPRFDPYSTLNVNPDTRGFSCVGHSVRRGGRCNKLISSQDRVAACAFLDRIAAKTLSKRRLESLLKKLAPIVLCKKRHQGQAERVVEEWVRKVDEAAVVIRRAAEEESMRGRERNASSRGRRQVEEESEESSESRSSDSDSDSDSDNDDSSSDVFSEPELESAAAPLSFPPEEITTTTNTAPVPPPVPTPPPSTASIFPPVPTPPPSTASIFPPAQTGASVRRKPIEGECSICYADIQEEPREELVWCKAQCGQNFHKACFDAWAAAAARTAFGVTCGYCRADWVD